MYISCIGLNRSWVCETERWGRGRIGKEGMGRKRKCIILRKDELVKYELETIQNLEVHFAF